MFKLYELTEMYQNIWDLVGDDEVDLDALETALSQIEDSIEVKAESTAKLIKGIDGEVATLTSVVFTNEDLIPDEYKKEVTTITIPKKEILEAIKLGQVVPGAEMRQTKSLRIR